VLEFIKAGGWLMLPILLCSVVAMGIITERFWTLQAKRIAPANLAAQVWQWAQRGELNSERLAQLRDGSALGRILAAGLSAQHLDRDRMKEQIEDVGRHVVHEMERYLNSLGTIAAITPLLGLLGTVIGMIKVFAVITTQGVGDAGILAGGISEALVTTAAGLTVAIPALMFYRYFRGRVDALVVTMEQEALKMVEALHNRSGEPANNVIGSD
jgi:biopolymer transport protein ExbB